MPYAIELYLDNKSSEIIKSIREDLRSSKINVDEGTDPHITLAIYDNFKLDIFTEKLKQFSDRLSSEDVTFSSMGIFVLERPVLFLAPVVTKILLSIHSDFYGYFKKYNEKAWDYYKPGSWVPHCTLGIELTWEMVKRANDIIKDLTLPIHGRLEKIGILEFKPNRHLAEFKLK